MFSAQRINVHADPKKLTSTVLAWRLNKLLYNSANLKTVGQAETLRTDHSDKGVNSM